MILYSSVLAATMLVFCSPLGGELIKVPPHLWGVNESERDHPGDGSFPTDMTFRKYADHRIDPTIEFFDPDLVKRGDTIYLGDWAIPWFVKAVHPKIKHPYIIISSDSDAWHPNSGTWNYDPFSELCPRAPPVEATRIMLYDSKVAAWFCKNSLISRHPKIFQIPIGPNIIYWGSCPKVLFEKVDALGPSPFEQEKKHLLYMAMQLASHYSRPYIAELFQDKPYCLSSVHQLKQQIVARDQFYDELSQSIFTLAPPGFGLDTVRFWEALVLGCIPIVKHSELDDLYADLPVLFVNDWSEINEPFLRQKQREILEKNLGTEKAYFEFWARKIKDVQEKVRKGTNDFSSLEATKFPAQTLSDLSTLMSRYTVKADRLLCKGAVMALRLFQIAEACSALSAIYVQDQWGPWSHECAAAPLAPFTQNPLLHHHRKISPINMNANPYAAFGKSSKSKTHVFFDLSYLRHRVDDELWKAYENVAAGAVICGTCGEDPFVKKALERFSIPRSIQIQEFGDLWFFIR